MGLCLSLLRLNVGAARRFYQLAGTHLSPGDTVQFILDIERALTLCIIGEGKARAAVGGKAGGKAAAGGKGRRGGGGSKGRSRRKGKGQFCSY